jgi:hypothetical protein
MSTAKVPFAQIGAVADSGRLRIKGVNGDKILDSSITELKEAWQTPFR